MYYQIYSMNVLKNNKTKVTKQQKLPIPPEDLHMFPRNQPGENDSGVSRPVGPVSEAIDLPEEEDEFTKMLNDIDKEKSEISEVPQAPKELDLGTPMGIIDPEDEIDTSDTDFELAKTEEPELEPSEPNPPVDTTIGTPEDVKEQNTNQPKTESDVETEAVVEIADVIEKLQSLVGAGENDWAKKAEEIGLTKEGMNLDPIPWGGKDVSVPEFWNQLGSILRDVIEGVKEVNRRVSQAKTTTPTSEPEPVREPESELITPPPESTTPESDEIAKIAEAL